MQAVSGAAVEHMCVAATLPDGVRLNFDPAGEGLPTASSSVQKVVRRTVVSLQHGRFQACETVRQREDQAEPVVERSALLPKLVARGGRYAFDLIAHVGVESYLHGRSLREIRERLGERMPPLDISLSSLWDQQQRFLFYLGHLHALATPVLRQYLAEHEPVTWLLDGTLEPGTPVLLGIKEAAHGMLLNSAKIASENIDDISACLRQAAERYGTPNRILHDLSSTISTGCERALPHVPHNVCHYHFANDVGKDLYEQPQDALCKRMRALQVQFHLKKQRYRQTEVFRREFASPAQLALCRLLDGETVVIQSTEMLHREVLMALQFWIQDYRKDGCGRGFPFDPYTLYLHRRLVRAGCAVDDLLSRPSVARQAPPVLFNFQQELRRYRDDPQIAAAAQSYEQACSTFGRLRQALRLTAENVNNLHQPHDLKTEQQQEIQTALETLRNELIAQIQSNTDRSLAPIVLEHLERYWLQLVPKPSAASDEPWHRTTNALESDWGHLKRCRRQAHGRGSLTRDFVALPQEYALVLNLQNATYVDLVLGGSLEALPSKLAEASHGAGPFCEWQQRRRPQLFGQLPRRLLREDEFVENLIAVCESHCEHQKAA